MAGSFLVIVCGVILSLLLHEALQRYSLAATPGPDGYSPRWYDYTFELASFASQAAPAFLAGLIWRHAGFAIGATLGLFGSLAISVFYLINAGTPLTLGNSGTLLCNALTLAIIASIACGAGELAGQRLSNFSSKRARERPRAG